MLALLAAPLSACDKLGALSGNPAQTCASPDTYDNLKALILQEAQSIKDPTPQLAAMLAKSQISITLPTLVSFDKDTKKTTCQAVFEAKWFMPLQSAKQGHDVFQKFSDSVTGQYTIQPQADGSGDVYGIDSDVATIRPTLGLVLNWLETDKEAAESASSGPNASAMPAPGTAGASPAQAAPSAGATNATASGDTAPTNPQP